MDPIKRLKLAYIELAAYYGVNLPDQVLCLYARDLSHVEPALVQAAMARLRLKMPRMPRPGDILDALQGEQVSVEARANEVAANIWHALGADGWTNPERAQKRIGPVGWSVVESLGGWQSLCKTEHEQRGTFFAQCRSLAKAALEREALPDNVRALPTARALSA